VLQQVPATTPHRANLISGEQMTVPRLILRYVATGLVVLVAVSVATVYASRKIGTQEAINNAIRATTLVAEVAVQPTLTDAAAHGDPDARSASSGRPGRWTPAPRTSGRDATS